MSIFLRGGLLTSSSICARAICNYLYLFTRAKIKIHPDYIISHLSCNVKSFFQPLGLHNIYYGQLAPSRARGWAGRTPKFWKVYQLRCQILIAAARAANSESCQILKELRQLQISGLVKFQWQLRFGPLPNFTMRSSCVWRGELPHSICSIWANENYEQDTRSEKNISKCVRFELFEVLSMFLFSGTKLGPLSLIYLFPNFGTAAILIFS